MMKDLFAKVKKTVIRYTKNEFARKKLRNKVTGIVWSVFRTVLLAGLSFIVLYPVIYMLSTAFRPLEQIYDPTVIWVPRSFTLKNIIEVAGPTRMDYWNSFINSVYICIGSSLLTVVSTSLTGYGFARFKFKGRNFLFGLVLFSIIVPPQTTIIPMYLNFKYFDWFGILSIGGFFKELFTGESIKLPSLLDGPLTFYLPAILANGIRAGLFIYIFRQFFRGLPKDLEDAAYVDGCGTLRTFFRVMIPSSGAAFLTVFLFSMVWYWNDYYYAGLFYMTEGNTIALKLANLRSVVANEFRWDGYQMIRYMQSGALIAIAPPLIIYIIFQRFFTESIERTGIVG